MPTEGVGTALGIASAAVGLWALMSPPIHEIRSQETSETMTRDVRHAELTAGGLTVAGGVIASYALSSPWPAVVAVGVVAFLVWEMEKGLAL